MTPFSYGIDDGRRFFFDSRVSTFAQRKSPEMKSNRATTLIRLAAKVWLEASYSTVKGNPSFAQVKQAEVNSDLSISNAFANSLDRGKTLFLLDSIRSLIFKEKSKSHFA